MNIDTDALLDSALLAVVGMGVVFVGLFILMVASIMMVRLSQSNKTTERMEAPPEAGISSAAGEAGEGSIAAVAVALALAMEEASVAPSVGPGRAAPMTQAGAGSTWAAAGREQLMRARGNAGHRWGRHPE